MNGLNRTHAILGGSDHCVATHPSDLAVALAALDADVEIHGPNGSRLVRIANFYRLPGDTPQIGDDLQPGEMITAIAATLPRGSANSHYLKVRERASYEFAVVSVAAVVAARTTRLLGFGSRSAAWEPFRGAIPTRNRRWWVLPSVTRTRCAPLPMLRLPGHGRWPTMDSRSSWDAVHWFAPVQLAGGVR